MTENASLLNTTTAEVGTRFDERRLSELPLATNRNVYNVALSAPGVSQLQSNQSGFTNGINYSANGGRLRSNNFLIDGQDNNDFGVGGRGHPAQQPRPDSGSAPRHQPVLRRVRAQLQLRLQRHHQGGHERVSRLRLLVPQRQRAERVQQPEQDRRASATPARPTRRARASKRPFRVENQLGGTIGGPLHLPRFGEGGPPYISGKDRTFFFFSHPALVGSPARLGHDASTARRPPKGAQILAIGRRHRPQVQALLSFLPVAQTPDRHQTPFTIGATARFTVAARLADRLAAPRIFNDWQTSFRVDHRFNDEPHSQRALHLSGLRTLRRRRAQSTPPGYESSNVSRNQGVNLVSDERAQPRTRSTNCAPPSCAPPARRVALRPPCRSHPVDPDHRRSAS